ncbi:MAG: DM13 domain-containing protein [Cyanobacteria bacterium J06598_3]
MQIQPLQRLKLVGMIVSMAALSYQPAMHASSATTVLSSVINRNDSVANTVKSSSPETSLEFTSAAVPTQLAQAAGAPFVSVDHPTTGSAQIVESDGQYYLEFDSAFRSDDGPDLFVLLHTQAVPESYGPNDFVNLGRLQSLEGAQRYAIPAGVDINALRSAVIWCQDFDVTFGYATL